MNHSLPVLTKTKIHHLPTPVLTTITNTTLLKIPFYLSISTQEKVEMSATQDQIATSPPPAKGGRTPSIPPHTEEDKIRIAKVEHAYFKEGRKLFDRKILKKISEILADYRAGKYAGLPPPTLEIPDFVDEDKNPYTINLDLGLHGNE